MGSTPDHRQRAPLTTFRRLCRFPVAVISRDHISGVTALSYLTNVVDRIQQGGGQLLQTLQGQGSGQQVAL